STRPFPYTTLFRSPVHPVGRLGQIRLQYSGEEVARGVDRLHQPDGMVVDVPVVQLRFGPNVAAGTVRQNVEHLAQRPDMAPQSEGRPFRDRKGTGLNSS